MSLGLHESRWRRRRTFRWKVLKALLVLGMLFAAGLFAYETGSMLAQQPVRNLEQQVAQLNESLTALRTRNTELSAAAQEAQARQMDWQQRYGQDVPTGQSKELFNLLRDRMAAGVETRRLAFVIKATSNERSCENGAVTRRFLVQTPLYKGANDSVSFGKQTITVTAQGPNAVNAEGNAEGWYDPAQSITVRFTEIGGKTSEATGKLPLHHSVVVGQSEYRFTVVPGARGFIKVSSERCQFP